VAAEASPDATTAISAEVAELKHQNEELRNRLNALEASTKAAPVAVVAAPALPPASAPVVAPMEPKTLNTNMKATVAAPADVLESRLSEKVSVSKELAASKVTAQKQATRFDAVPDQHITEIAQRLKYANEILKRFGRAYDYRATTLREFKHVLAELEDAEEKQKDIN